MKDVCIGAGGSGKVYRIWKEEEGCFVVEKRSRDSLLWEAFWLEKLQGFSVPCFYGVERKKGCWTIQMEYVTGRSLRQLLVEGKLDRLRRISIMKSMVRELNRIRKNFPEIVFCDIKPANVMVNQRNEITLIDFGAITQPGAGKRCFGTKPYAAPELLQGNPGRKSDIYSIGQIMWQLNRKKKNLFFYFVIRPCIRKKEVHRTDNLDRIYRRISVAERAERWVQAIKYIRKKMFGIMLFLLVYIGIKKGYFSSEKIGLGWEEMKNMCRMLLFVKLGRSWLL